MLFRSLGRSALLPVQEPSNTPTSPLTPPTPVTPSISLIGSAAFLCASKLPGSQTFKIQLLDVTASGKFASVSDDIPNLVTVPEEHHDFADVLSKKKANTLVTHHPYDLKINLKEGASPPIGSMYSLSQTEQLVLRDFIDEHLRIGFIRHTSSPHGAPVLFKIGRAHV